LVVLAACGTDPPATVAKPEPAPAHPAVDAAPALPASDAYADLATALARTIPDDTRVIGFGEIHGRTDRAQVRSAISRFTTDGLPAIADSTSDLIIETWLIDKGCEKTAQEATARVETTIKRPIETKNEVAELADRARAAKIQPHAMRVTCDDYARIAPPGKAVDAEALLALATKELARIVGEAVIHRDREANPRKWIAVYGGALHNDRFPEKGTADWSYAAKADAATKGRFVEIDLIVPELAEPDDASKRQPWYPLVAAADAKVHVWKRGERSFVVVFPRTPK
jgi:hypothetical protein